MGRKISIDSSTMMNKVFELIEAIKIFNINKNKISIIIHPTSYIHAIIFFKGGIIKLLAHNTSKGKFLFQMQWELKMKQIKILSKNNY